MYCGDLKDKIPRIVRDQRNGRLLQYISFKKKKKSAEITECLLKVAENIGSYSDANIHNIIQAQEVQSTERAIAATCFSSAIVNMTADNFFWGEVRGSQLPVWD